ncbi:MAG TPA: efflux RND transporter periplasmic adaptor subunit [Gemmatimonadales bacterium]|nr:efflux RND transporter periplasmic adaptor subunit [Gemmatimonadales bacterium]
MKQRLKILLGATAVLILLIWWLTRPPRYLTLTGIVTTDDVIVSPMVSGQMGRFLVAEGDSVKRGELLGTIQPAELRADQSYYQHSAEGFAAQAAAGAATLKFQEQQAASQVQQADANLAATRAQQAEAQATLDNARRNWVRADTLARAGQLSPQDADQSHTTFVVSQARLDAVNKQVAAAEAAVTLAHAQADQVVAMRNTVLSARQQEAAATAQATKADVRLGYTELRAPIDGFVDVRAARVGEVVNVGQPVITLIDPDDLWIRADVEESYADRVRPGDSLEVRLPSGEMRRGVVFYRGVDAGFATQRDVSRTKRDIKTFEIRIRVDNHDRRLAVGMTAYVLFPTARAPEGGAATTPPVPRPDRPAPAPPLPNAGQGASR